MKQNRILLAIAFTAVSSASLFASSETDQKIKDAAENSYNYRKVLDNRVSVAVSDGVVTLTGTVQDQDQKNLAEDTARNIPDVTRVDDQIQVDTSMAEKSDGWIAFKIHTQLLLRSNVSALNTHVDVKEGVVTLSGTADNQAQKELTELYVKDIEGVKSVDNNLVVQSPPDNGRTVGTSIDDASITTAIKYELLTHRGSSAAKTKVKTRDGVVTLAGEADSSAEKALATKFAENTRGVKSVDNEMTVKGD